MVEILKKKNDRISSKLMSCTKSKIQESQRTLSRINVKTNSKLGDTIFKIQKIKDEEKNV